MLNILFKFPYNLTIIWVKFGLNLHQIYMEFTPNLHGFLYALHIFFIPVNNCQVLLIHKIKNSFMEVFFVLDASAFINGFELEDDNYFTVPEITAEIKDFESRLKFDSAIEENRLVIMDVSKDSIDSVDEVISKSGDSLRLSVPDKKLISLAYMFFKEGKNVKVISDDYTIQNTLKIMNIPYSGIITEGIKGVYNWKKVCEGCKREYDEDYPFDDCEICGSRIFKKRIKVNR